MVVIEVVDSDDDEEEVTIPMKASSRQQAPSKAAQTQQRVFQGGQTVETVSASEVIAGGGSAKDSDEDDSDDTADVSLPENTVDEDNLKLVMDHLNISEHRAAQALVANNGDPVEAILAVEEEEERRRSEAPGSEPKAKMKRELVVISAGSAQDEADFVPFPNSIPKVSQSGGGPSVPAPIPTAPTGQGRTEPVQQANAHAVAERKSSAQQSPAAPSPSSTAPNLTNPSSSLKAATSQPAVRVECGLVTIENSTANSGSAQSSPLNKTQLFKAIDAAMKSGGDEKSWLACLSRLSPAQFPKLFGGGLEELDLLRLFRAAAAAASLSSETKGLAFRLVKGVAMVPRAHLTTSMLAKKDKQEVEAVLASLQPTECDGYTAEEWETTRVRFLKWP